MFRQTLDFTALPGVQCFFVWTIPAEFRAIFSCTYKSHGYEFNGEQIVKGNQLGRFIIEPQVSELEHCTVFNDRCAFGKCGACMTDETARYMLEHQIYAICFTTHMGVVTRNSIWGLTFDGERLDWEPDEEIDTMISSDTPDGGEIWERELPGGEKIRLSLDETLNPFSITRIPPHPRIREYDIYQDPPVALCETEESYKRRFERVKLGLDMITLACIAGYTVEMPKGVKAKDEG